MEKDFWLWILVGILVHANLQILWWWWLPFIFAFDTFILLIYYLLFIIFKEDNYGNDW